MPVFLVAWYADGIAGAVIALLSSIAWIPDVVSRLGGDEFAVLLPETGYEASGVVIQEVFEGLREVMRRKGWLVTFSIGVVTSMIRSV